MADLTADNAMQVGHYLTNRRGASFHSTHYLKGRDNLFISGYLCGLGINLAQIVTLLRANWNIGGDFFLELPHEDTIELTLSPFTK